MGHLFSAAELVFLLVLSSLSCYTYGSDCSSSCGNVIDISYPFRLDSDPTDCGDSFYQLTCENNHTILERDSKKYYVEEIDYENVSIRIVDPGLLGDNCSYIPSYFDNDGMIFYTPDYSLTEDIFVFVKCFVPVHDSLYIAATQCRENNGSGAAYPYVLLGRNSVGDFHEKCNVAGMAPGYNGNPNLNYSGIRDLLQNGIWGYWIDPRDSTTSARFSCSVGSKPGHCILHHLRFIRNVLLSYEFVASYRIIGYILLARTAVGLFCLSVFLLYKLQRRHLAMDAKIEDFLGEYKKHMPTRYSYWELSKMTDRFKDKVGRGGFGSVFKGKLPNGQPIAVKMLGKSKGNGQDFINEVATIGRIHHVHVVQLIGFCAERSKRALVYEFMPNGSLEKYLFSEDVVNSRMSWMMLHEIALGVARGIDYLHRGCEMRIIHFDIKPHNILLDENFVPKVSDFGLAKLHPTEDSIVSLSAVRGTMGYIAPELFYRRVGNVSHKSDVYSYGMLLMEMAGRRKNVKPDASHSSQFYFPSWIYDQLDRGDLAMGDATDDERNTAKKMIIVALWCIQMKPIDRPSMSRVVEMLEGSVEHLEMPAKPFVSSPHTSPLGDHVIELEPAEPSGEPSSVSLISPR